MVMYVEAAKLIFGSDYKPLINYYSPTNNKKVDNWSFKLNKYGIHFECLLDLQNILPDWMLCLLHLGLTEKPPEEGYEPVDYIFKEESPLNQVM